MSGEEGSLRSLLLAPGFMKGDSTGAGAAAGSPRCRAGMSQHLRLSGVCQEGFVKGDSTGAAAPAADQ